MGKTPIGKPLESTQLNFSSGGALNSSVCVYDGAIWGESSQDHNVFDFSGKRYFRVHSDPSMLSSARAVWREDSERGGAKKPPRSQLRRVVA